MGMHSFFGSVGALALAVVLPFGLSAACTDDSQGQGARANLDGSTEPGDGGPSGPDAHYPTATPTDPCATSGYYFDGKSDCDVVRCPELTCKCPSTLTVEPGAPPPPLEEITLHACVYGKGCLALADCARICDPGKKAIRAACEGRIAAAGSQSCVTDADCVAGTCREESVGKICIDTLPCGQDGHCGPGSICFFETSALDPKTGLPIATGSCADGLAQSPCQKDGDCTYGRCSGNRCNGGLENEQCQFNSNCASGFCRIASTDTTGTCVSGKIGGSCADDGDCGSGLHCSGYACHSGDVGQPCDGDAQCTSGICVS